MRCSDAVTYAVSAIPYLTERRRQRQRRGGGPLCGSMVPHTRLHNTLCCRFMARQKIQCTLGNLQEAKKMDAVSEYPLRGKTWRVAWFAAVHCLNVSCASARSWRSRLCGVAILRVPVALPYPPWVLASEYSGDAPHGLHSAEKRGGGDCELISQYNSQAKTEYSGASRHRKLVSKQV